MPSHLLPNPLVVSLLAFGCLFCAALAGMLLRRRLPEHHLDDQSKDAVRIGMGSVATMAALVLGLLVASAKNAYDTEKSEITQLAAKVTYLDQVLINCGPGATESRALLRQAVRASILRLWPTTDVKGAMPPDKAWSQALPCAIQQIKVSDESQHAFKSQAASLANELAQMRWLLFEQIESSISVPLLAIMLFWLTLTSISVGLYAPPNGTVLVAQCMAALSVAGALFLILELDHPFTGLIRISSKPMVNALQQLQQ
jgi:hypothetical protein